MSPARLWSSNKSHEPTAPATDTVKPEGFGDRAIGSLSLVIKGPPMDTRTPGRALRTDRARVKAGSICSMVTTEIPTRSGLTCLM